MNKYIGLKFTMLKSSLNCAFKISNFIVTKIYIDAQFRSTAERIAV